MKQLHTLNIFQLAKMARRNPMLAEACNDEVIYRQVNNKNIHCSLPKKQQRLMGLLPALPSV